jgi:ribonuclease-3
MLNAVVAELLYTHYPKKREGELTKMRAWLVSRRQLNLIANQMGLNDFIFHGMDNQRVKEARHIEGNVLEALIGAYYLDGGLEVVKAITLKWIFSPEILKEALEGSKDPISLLYEWSQKKRKQLFFDHTTSNISNPLLFKVQLKVDKQLVVSGEGRTKKDAERDAAQKAIQQLGI